MNSPTLRRCRAGLLLCALVLARPATAQEDEFKRHFEHAAALYKDRQYDEAIEELKAAYAIRQLPRVLLNLGHAYRKLGQAREALRYYRQYLHVEAHPSAELKKELDSYIEQTQALVDAEKPAPAPEGQPGGPVSGPAGQGVVAPRPGPPGLLTGQGPVAAVHEPSPARVPVYKKWWLWTAVGVVAAGAVTGAVVATRPWDAGVPDGVPLVHPKF